MMRSVPRTDIVMLGTFGMWRLGTLQARALPFATELHRHGVQSAIVTTPWDTPDEAGVVDAINSIPVINTRNVSTRLPAGAVREQIAWVRRLQPQIVHVFKPKGFGGLAARLMLSSHPVIVDSDDWEGDGGWNQAAGYRLPQRRLFQFQEIDLLRRATRVTAASMLLAERAAMLRRESSGAGVHRIVNGLTRERMTALAGARRLPPSRIDPPVVLLYSRFAEFEETWLDAFLTALDRLTTRPLTVRVIGPSSSEPSNACRYRSLIVELMGYVASGGVPDLIASSSLAIYPYRDSLIARSKQSVKLLEQMAAGCPMIVSDVGDLARTVGSAGVAIQGASPVDFARKAVKLIEQPLRLDRMSVESQNRVREHFGFEHLAERLLDVYRSAGLR